MKLMVLDGNSLVNRAFFGIKLLTTKDGRYTNAIYGFQIYCSTCWRRTSPTPSPSRGMSVRRRSATPPTTATRPPATVCRKSWRSRCRY